MSRFINATWIAALVIVLGAFLSGCSKQYLEPSYKVSPHAGDAIATNRVTQMVDPWSAYSANNRIAYDGQKMQAAVERYRNNQVTPPKGTGTSNSYQQAQQGSGTGAAANTTPVGPTVTQPAASVK